MRVRERLEHTTTLLAGMAIGAGLMYIFDESRGTRRRAEARQKLAHVARLAGRSIDKHSRDLANRIAGSVAELRSSIRDQRRVVDDDRLVERVRAQLGHVISHPALLDVGASAGFVTVRGPVLPAEVEKAEHRIRKIRGVKDCRLELEPRENLDRISGIRGGPRDVAAM